MSHIEQFATPFSKGKNYAVIKDIARAITSDFGLTPLEGFDQWSPEADPPTYSIEYDERSTEGHVLGMRMFNALFEKNRSVGSTSAEVRERKTLAKWLEAEDQCRVTNDRFRFPASGHSPELQTLIFKVSRKIAGILGACPKLQDLDLGFGPGASVGVSRLTSVRRKLSAVPTLSANAVVYLSTLQDEHPFWGLEKYQITRGKLTFVQKSSSIDRPIVVEPIINTYVQKGIGTYIRSQLRRAGVDLNSQETNRDFARFGSLTDLVSTIDLSSASDTISKEVVAELLPYEWLSLLSSFRTPEVDYKGQTYRLHKFSSMGNGYTFELESLIFFAICSVVCEGSKFVNVYGDDLIVPSRFYEPVVRALEAFGFSVNLKKSYATGPFRESCGKDFLKGVDVRPCYVKDRFSFKELFRYHNFCKRNGYDNLASLVLRHIPRQLLQFTGPDGFGDGHLIGDWTPIRKHRERGWSLLGFRTLTAKPFEKKDRTKGDYGAFLYGSTSVNQMQNRSCWEAPSGGYDSLPDVITSRTMYIERGGSRYRVTKVNTWAS